MDQSDSGFYGNEIPFISSSFEKITLLHDSNQGYCRLYKAQRMGKWFVLKCLKKEYADIPKFKKIKIINKIDKINRDKYHIIDKNAFLEVMQTRAMKDIKNQINRRSNFESANLSRSIEAGLKQVAVIEEILSKITKQSNSI